MGFLLRRARGRTGPPYLSGHAPTDTTHIMKGLNFWQWLGIGLLVLGAIMLFTRKTQDPTPGSNQPAPTAPTTLPASDRTLR